VRNRGHSEASQSPLERFFEDLPPGLEAAIYVFVAVLILAILVRLLRRGDTLLWATEIEFDGWSVTGRYRSLFGGSSYEAHVPLSQLSFVGTLRLQQPWLLVLAILALFGGVHFREEASDTLSTVLYVVSGILVTAYFFLRRRTISFISSSGSGVGLSCSPLRGGMSDSQHVVEEVRRALEDYQSATSHFGLEPPMDEARARSIS